MDNSQRIVVIGGGIIGASAACHLLRAGARQVTLVDAITPGAATTNSGAGFVSHWSAGMLPEIGAPGFHMQQYGLDFYRELHQQQSALGVDIGYRPNGTLIMALTAAGRDYFLEPVLDSPFAPLEMQDLKPTEIAARTSGLVDARKIHSAAFNPHGIQIDTGHANIAVLNEVRYRGGTVLSNHSVLTIKNTAAGVRLNTTQGRLVADMIIIAAGAWTNVLMSQLGWPIPILKVVATRLVTNKLGLLSTLPTIQCRELRLWLRESRGAITWGSGDGYADVIKLGVDNMPPGQPHCSELLANLASQQNEKLELIFPPLRGSYVESWKQGIPCYTPDNKFLLGPVPGHPNIFCAAGDNETGVTHGPALGRVLAELALGQNPFVDIGEFKLTRFSLDQFPSVASILASRPVWEGDRAIA